MKRLLSVLCAACLFCFAGLAISDASAGGQRKVCICHVPPGNPGNEHTICVGAPAVPAHLEHGDSLGTCQEVCDGIAGDTCGPTQFCMHDPGSCDPGTVGVCTETPDDCPPTGDAVCGCDGLTYPNACLAAAAGVSVDGPGPCDSLQTCGGSAASACPAGELCRRETGSCDAGSPGVCVAIPTTCPAALSPVCGCDGMSYSNDCYTDVTGVPVLHAGECAAPQLCGGSTNASCPAGSFCKRRQGACDATAEGVCLAIPETCPASLVPSCGCDGRTYSNPCVADGAGVTVAHEGACNASTE